MAFLTGIGGVTTISTANTSSNIVYLGDYLQQAQPYRSPDVTPPPDDVAWLRKRVDEVLFQSPR